jgi:hypothetical protein
MSTTPTLSLLQRFTGRRLTSARELVEPEPVEFIDDDPLVEVI